MIKTLGYILLTVSCSLFLLTLVVPWFDFSNGVKAGLITALIIAGEILFYLSIFLIGKDFIIKMKDKLRFWKVKSNNKVPTSSE